MKLSYSAAIVLISFIGIAVFGFFGMGQSVNFVGCIASLTGGGSCPEAAAGLEYASFHLNILNVFFNAVIDGGLLAVIMAVFALAIFMAVSGIHNLPGVLLEYGDGRYPDFPRPLYQSHFTSWWSLHENSPATV